MYTISERTVNRVAYLADGLDDMLRDSVAGSGRRMTWGECCHALRKFRDDARTLYTDIAGNDPWEEREHELHPGD